MTNYITKTIKNGVEANVPVTSVNWQYGDVVIQTGGNYTAGNWIDITNDEIWLDGTYNDYSAMQWPAPDGFHVPNSEERISMINIWIALWAWTSGNGSGTKTYLKMPYAWIRVRNTWDVSSQWTAGDYWLCERQITTYNSWMWYYYNNNANLTTKLSAYLSTWMSIRPFKDKSVVPESSWTKLYGTSIESWWIFWSSTDWLISLSSDWQNWITISDKNLWATTVYNDGDTLSEANCGKYYQRWNNYWFPRTWTVTTSSTTVNAGSYWPWNYYSSSTFIIINWDWSSVENDDLWGGVTWAVSWNLVINDSTGPKSIVKIRWWTQAEYDALTTKDSSTLYFTTDS